MKLFSALTAAMLIMSGCMTYPYEGEVTGEQATNLEVRGLAAYSDSAIAVFARNPDVSSWTNVGWFQPTDTPSTLEGLTGYAWSGNVNVANHVKCNNNFDGTVVLRTVEYRAGGAGSTVVNHMIDDPISCWFGDGQENWGNFYNECVTPSKQVFINVNLQSCLSY